MTIDASQIELERQRLTESMAELIAPFIDVELYNEFGFLPLAECLQPGIERLGLGGVMSPQDVINLSKLYKSLGVLKKCALVLSCFGVANHYLREGKSDNPLADLLSMENCLGVVQGAVMFGSASYHAAKQGGAARSKAYKTAKDRVVEIYLKMPGSDGMSSEKVAEEMLGMNGLNLGSVVTSYVKMAFYTNCGERE